jgi:undecaprenyl-diphosphatase
VSPELLWKGAILGLVEGATEFIPVSSTGHLIVVSNWLGLVDERAKTFDVFIQLGAILSIVWLYRTRLWRTVVAARHDTASRRFLGNLLVAFLPAGIVGFLTHSWIKAWLFNPTVVAVALVVGGVLILVIERLAPPPQISDVSGMPTRTAVGIGLAQVLSLIPGVSRSGATIMGGYSLGLSRTAATEFSFFLAIPVMFAATLYDLVKSWSVLAPGDIPLFAVGFIVSFASALVVVKAFLSYVSGHSFRVFAWYRIGFGAVLLLTRGVEPVGTSRSLVSEPGGFREGTAFFCEGAEAAGLAPHIGALLPRAPMCPAAARGLASGQKNAVLRRGPLAAARKLPTRVAH